MDALLLGLGREALILALVVSAPPLVAALLTGLVVGALQAATQIQDPGVAVVPRVCAVVGAVIIAAPWIGAHVVRFALACLRRLAELSP
jgi:flagellar biosynthesis protein FliQ